MRLFARLCLGVAICTLGCIPRNVTWTADSSGFVFVGPSNEIHYWDAKANQSRPLINEPWLKEALLHNAQPAVSPDGQQIAIVRCTTVGKKEQAELFLYDRDGKLVLASAKQPLSGENVNQDVVYVPMSTWSPDGRWIVFHCVERWRTLTVAYDVQQKKFREMPGIMPADEFSSLFGLPIMLPDGSGFLAFEVSEKPHSDDDFLGPMYFAWGEAGFEGLRVVRWNGSKERFSVARNLTKDAIERRFSGKDTPEQELIAPSAQWVNQTAMLSFLDEWFRIDTRNRTITSVPSPGLKKLSRFARSHGVGGYQFPTGVILQYKKKPHPEDQPQNGTEFEDTIQITPQGSTQPISLLENVEVDGATDVSPNGAMAVISYRAKEKPGVQRLLVVSNEGKVIADLVGRDEPGYEEVAPFDPPKGEDAPAPVAPPAA